jgi:hypothetical protein
MDLGSSAVSATSPPSPLCVPYLRNVALILQPQIKGQEGLNDVYSEKNVLVPDGDAATVTNAGQSPRKGGAGCVR